MIVNVRSAWESKVKGKLGFAQTFSFKVIIPENRMQGLEILPEEMFIGLRPNIFHLKP